jgi:hypothetical protein
MVRRVLIGTKFGIPLAAALLASSACEGERPGQGDPAASPPGTSTSSAPGATGTAPNPPPSPGAAPAPTAAGAHAPKGVTPASHDDWCGEHAVPESLCTRCNQSLVPAFKATGDWCPEHGLPESQCLLCNPNLKIVRPAKAGGG